LLRRCLFDIDAATFMKKFFLIAVVMFFPAVLLFVSYRWQDGSAWKSLDPKTVTMLKNFVAIKKAQAYAATNNVPPEIQMMFKYAERGNWLALSNSFQDLREQIKYWDSLGYGVRHWHGYRGAVEDFVSDVAEKIGWHWEPKPPSLTGIPGEAIVEVHGAFEAFVAGNEKYSTQFGREIINSIPAGSIYFGDTDPGRFIVTVMCKSQSEGNPFFTLTQKALADMTYVDYLRGIYGRKIYLPTEADREKCFQDYVAAVQARITNYNDVMDMNSLLVKLIFEKNPNRAFYIDENYPIAWMYSYLEPHGLIFKINRMPAEKLSDEILQRDHDFWTNQIQPMIGGWLTDETSVKEIAAFAKKIFGRKDFNGFNGDTNFVENTYTTSMYSKSRSSIAGLYAWRAQNTHDELEKKRMTKLADFAFRQAWALSPYNIETIYRYVSFLLEQSRFDDALLIAETAEILPQIKEVDQIAQLLAQIKKLQAEKYP
jgi:hypothetical protein